MMTVISQWTPTMMLWSISGPAPIVRSHASVESKFQILNSVSICKFVQKLEFIVEIVKFPTIINRRSMIVLSTSGISVVSLNSVRNVKNFTSTIFLWNVLMAMLCIHRKEKLIGKFSMDSFFVTLVNWATYPPKNASGGAWTNATSTSAMTVCTRPCLPSTQIL